MDRCDRDREIVAAWDARPRLCYTSAFKAEIGRRYGVTAGYVQTILNRHGRYQNRMVAPKYPRID